MILELDHDQSGGLECLGQMWTWVSGEAVAAATLSGIWQDVQHLYADRQRVAISADRMTVAIHADRQRAGVTG